MGAVSASSGFAPARVRHAINGFGLLAVVLVGALGAVRPIVAQASTGTDYPMLGYNATHSSVSPDTTVSASSWDAFTLKHKVVLGGFILSSPAVVYNTNLNKNVAYVVTSGAPSVAAVDVATGAILWQKPLVQDAYSSPTVFGNTVYFGSEDFNLYAFDATTGALDCTFNTGGRIEASPLVENIDGTGPTVFFGDTGKSEARNAGHEWALYGVGNTAGAACTQRWMFNSWNNNNHGADGGSWSSPALATDHLGRQLLVFGSNQPDDSVYGLNAVTGAEVWRFQTAVGADSDVGAAPTISLPGVNGITDGAVYVMGKDQHEYALDLTTGGPGWQDFVVEHPEHSPHYQYDLADPEDTKTWRRSIYRFIVRSQTQPWMTSLDCADPSMRVDRRNESLSALQALALLNNGFMVTQARHFAERVQGEAPDLGGQVERAYELALGHAPSAADRERLIAFAQANGLPNLCRVLFNLNEFIFVD